MTRRSGRVRALRKKAQTWNCSRFRHYADRRGTNSPPSLQRRTPPNLSASILNKPHVRNPTPSPQWQLRTVSWGLLPARGQGSEDDMPTLPDSDVGRTVTVVCPSASNETAHCSVQTDLPAALAVFNGGADGWASLVREVSAPLTPGERRVRSRSAGTVTQFGLQGATNVLASRKDPVLVSEGRV